MARKKKSIEEIVQLTPEQQAELSKNQKAGRVARRVGYDAERRFASTFRKAGWDKAVTMRYVSKMKDDRKIDVAFVPVNMQIKAGKQKALNPRQLLEEIQENVLKLPDHYPERQHHCVVVHPRTPGAGHARTKFDDIVYMTFEDYFTLLCMLHDKGKFTPTVALLNEEGNPIINEEIEGDANNLSQSGSSSSI